MAPSIVVNWPLDWFFKHLYVASFFNRLQILLSCWLRFSYDYNQIQHNLLNLKSNFFCSSKKKYFFTRLPMEWIHKSKFDGYIMKKRWELTSIESTKFPSNLRIQSVVLVFISLCHSPDDHEHYYLMSDIFWLCQAIIEANCRFWMKFWQNE